MNLSKAKLLVRSGVWVKTGSAGIKSPTSKPLLPDTILDMCPVGTGIGKAQHYGGWSWWLMRAGKGQGTKSKVGKSWDRLRRPSFTPDLHTPTITQDQTLRVGLINESPQPARVEGCSVWAGGHVRRRETYFPLPFRVLSYNKRQINKRKKHTDLFNVSLKWHRSLHKERKT